MAVETTAPLPQLLEPPTALLGAIAVPGWARPLKEGSVAALVIAGKGTKRVLATANKALLVVGRSPACELVLEGTTVSRRHAAVLFDSKGMPFIADIATANGTTIDGVPLRPWQPIPVADRLVRFGEEGPFRIVIEKEKSEPEKKRTKLMPEDRGVLTEVHCAHILIKHRGSRRPSSWKQERVTRTKEEAIAIARSLRASLADGCKQFAEVARSESDCSSAKKGGDLGVFARGTMQKPFENAAFALAVNELSDIVETDSGIHIILRLA